MRDSTSRASTVCPATTCDGISPEVLPLGSRPLLQRVGVFALHMGLFAPLTFQAVYRPERWAGPDDFTKHIEVVVPLVFRTPWEPGAPHFLWHLLVKVVAAVVPGADAHLGALLVSIAFAGLTGLVWFEVLRMSGSAGHRVSPLWALFGSIALLAMEAPATLQGWDRIRPPDVFLPLFAYHNATGLAERPAAAILLVLVVRAFGGCVDEAARASAIRWMPVAVVVSTLIRPSVSPGLAVAALVMIWVWGRRDGRTTSGPQRTLLVRFVLPCVLLGVGQYVIMSSRIPEAYRQTSKIAPFEILRMFNGFEPRFWSLMILPVAMLLVWRRRLLADRYVELSLACVVAGIVALALLSSSDPGRQGPEAGWFVVQPLQLFLLFGARRAIELVRTDRRRHDVVGIAACGALAVLYVFTFLNFYSCQMVQACLARA